MLMYIVKWYLNLFKKDVGSWIWFFPECQIRNWLFGNLVSSKTKKGISFMTNLCKWGLNSPLENFVYALLLIINLWAEIQHMPIDSQYNICFMPIENVSSHLGWIFFFICVRGNPLLCKNHKNRQFYFEKS